MSSLARRLRQRGYQTYTPSYASLFRTPEQNKARITRQLRHLSESKTHIVAHSYGGILALRLLASNLEAGTPMDIGRVVLMGTPVQGSELAQIAIASRWKKALLGRAAEVLCEGMAKDALQRITSKWSIGVIAGTQNRAYLGRLVGRLPEGDGVVATHETELPGAIAKHLSVSHTDMLWSDSVAVDIIHFLVHGRYTETHDEVS